MTMLMEVVSKEMLEPGSLVDVIHRLQALDATTDEKQRLLTEWSGRAGRLLPAWALAAVELPREAE